jgi:hypothetical protein
MFSSGFIRLALLHYGLNKERCSALAHNATGTPTPKFIYGLEEKIRTPVQVHQYLVELG